MDNFDKVFESAIETMHEQNVKTFGSAMANIMKVGLVELRPIFKVVYHQGYTDCENSQLKETSQERLARIRSYNY